MIILKSKSEHLYYTRLLFKPKNSYKIIKCKLKIGNISMYISNKMFNSVFESDFNSDFFIFNKKCLDFYLLMPKFNILQWQVLLRVGMSETILLIITIIVIVIINLVGQFGN